MRELEYDNPFSQGEISNLGYAREENDIEYLKAWTRKAVTFYENYRNNEVDNITKASKWDKLIDALSKGIIDKDDLVDLEYGPEELQTSEKTEEADACPYCGSTNTVEKDPYFDDDGVEWMLNYCHDCKGEFDENTGNVRTSEKTEA